MFRVQTEKERIAQAYREKIVVFPPRSRYGSGSGARSGSRSGSGTQGRGGVWRSSSGRKTAPPQAPSRGAGQKGPRGASSSGGKQKSSRRTSPQLDKHLRERAAVVKLSSSQ